jgi:hypothetical protein
LDTKIEITSASKQSLVTLSEGVARGTKPFSKLAEHARPSELLLVATIARALKSVNRFAIYAQCCSSRSGETNLKPCDYPFSKGGARFTARMVGLLKKPVASCMRLLRQF